jgi:hypothetical protein
MTGTYVVAVEGEFEIREAISTGDGDLEPGDIVYGVGHGTVGDENERTVNELLADMERDGCDFVAGDGMDLSGLLVDAQTVAVGPTDWHWEDGSWVPPS